MIKYILIISIILSSAICKSTAFIENMGQWADSVLFLHQTPNANYWLCKDKIIYDSFKLDFSKEDSIKFEGFASSISFKSINKDFTIRKTLCKAQQIIGKSVYDTVVYNNFYDNIDLRFISDKGKLRFDFLCDEKSNTDDIRIVLPSRFATDLQKNRLVSGNSKYQLIIDSLKTYTESEVNISSRFVKKDNHISIRLDETPSCRYIIDPIIYSTFLGGSSYEYARDVSVSNGYIYTVGYTSSKNFPVKEGAYTEFLKESEAGEVDVIISKFDSKGDSLIAGTFFGSYFNDYAESICTDSLGNVYITGYFESNSTFPITSNAADTTLQSGYEGFIACFDSDLKSLKYCTLLSGSADDFPQKVKYLQNQKQIAVCGYTYSGDSFPISDDKHLSLASKKADAFLLKLNLDLSEIKESSIWGGEDDDFCHDFIYSSGAFTTVGYAMSNDFPLLNQDTVFTKSKDSLYGDAFITQIRLSESFLQKSILLSGIKKDIAYSIANLNDTAFSIAGYTESIDFPVTEGAFDTEYSNGISVTKGDAFVAKFDNNLNPYYISFFGGAETDRAFDCDHDSKGNTYITGSTYSTDFPVKGPYINNYFADTSGNSDAFLSKVNRSGDKLLYSSYIGGSKIDIAKAIYVQNNDYAIVTGWTSSPDFPVQEGSLDTVHNNNNLADIFSLKILPSRIEFEEGNELFLCDIDTIDIHTVLYDFDVIDTTYWVPDYNISDVSTISTTVFPDSSITYTLYVRDTTGFIDSASISIEIIIFPEQTISGTDKVKPDIEYQYSVSSHPYITYDWKINAGDILSKVDSNSITVKWDDPYQGFLKLYYLTDYGCKDSTEIFNVTYDTIVKPHITPITKTKVCKGQPVIFDAGAGYKAYQWSTGSTTRYDTVYSAGLYWAVLKDNNDVIHFTDSVFVILMPLPQIPSVNVNGDLLTSTEEDLFYQWYLNGIPIPNAVSKSYRALESGYYQVELKNKNECTNKSDSTYVTATSFQDRYDNFEYEYSQDVLRIEYLYDFYIQIYNITGENVYKSPARKSLYLDLSNWPAGVYIVDIFISDKKAKRVYKLLKY